MKRFLFPLLFLAAVILLWGIITWPLVARFSAAVPATPRAEPGTTFVGERFPGDHVQLLYHFWLARDMIAGKTPTFSNIYEFNMGDDAARYRFDPYYLPFSLFYALFSPFFGDAFAWNFTALLSVLLGALGLYLLARCYTESRFLACAIALLMTAFPYRWTTLLCGSPTGFSMPLIAWIFYGLDRAIRRGSLGGGIIGGIALFFAYCSDLHVFYFAGLATPLWAIFVFINGRAPFRRLLVALLPFALFGVAAIVLSSVAAENLAESDMAAGRSWQELRLYSPIQSGLFRMQNLGQSNHAFFGCALTALLLFGFLRAVRFPRREKLRVALLSASVFLVILIALGTYSPFDAAAVKLARAYVPKFGMIRQTVKIFCLLPPILTVLLAFLFDKSAAKRARFVFCFLALASIVEVAFFFRPGLSEFPEMLAYPEAADILRASGQTPRAVAVPLWPSDSHFSAAYEYGVTKSRIRLLNGYSAAIPTNFTERVIAPLSVLNQGVCGDREVGALRELGVNLILFHEQPFPAKVSPFPASIILYSYLTNPRLRCIASHAGIWAFEVCGAEKSAAHGEVRAPEVYSSSYHWFGVTNPVQIKLRIPEPPMTNLHFTVCGNQTLLTAGAEISPRLATNGASIFIPAADFFHLGQTSADRSSVLFTPKITPNGIALYGPQLPVPAGRYRIALESRGKFDAAGVLRVTSFAAEAPFLGEVPIRGGEKAVVDCTIPAEVPLRVEFHYNSRAVIEVLGLSISRREILP